MAFGAQSARAWRSSRLNCPAGNHNGQIVCSIVRVVAVSQLSFSSHASHSKCTNIISTASTHFTTELVAVNLVRINTSQRMKHAVCEVSLYCILYKEKIIKERARKDSITYQSVDAESTTIEGNR